MKKILSFLLITAFVAHSTLLPVQETGWQKVKNFFTSKPMMFLYGTVLGAGTIIFLLDAPKNNTTKNMTSVADNDDAHLKQQIMLGQKVSEAIKEYKGVAEYFKAIIKDEWICVDNPADAVYIFKIRSHHTYDEFQRASKVLEKAKNYLDSYNEYKSSQALPSIRFSCQKGYWSGGYVGETQLKEIKIYTT